MKKKYGFKENVKELDSSLFKINANHLLINHERRLSSEDASVGLGLIGAVIGSIGGPIGAFVGGAVGGFIGSLFGESLAEAKQKTFNALVPKLEEIEEQILKNLSLQMPKIESDLLLTIKDNFNKNKSKAIKMLIEAK